MKLIRFTLLSAAALALVSCGPKQEEVQGETVRNEVVKVEPLQKSSPFTRLYECDNVILTPHMAWGAYESRIRCMDEIAENIKSFYEGGRKGRIV